MTAIYVLGAVAGALIALASALITWQTAARVINAKALESAALTRARTHIGQRDRELHQLRRQLNEERRAWKQERNANEVYLDEVRRWGDEATLVMELMKAEVERKVEPHPIVVALNDGPLSTRQLAHRFVGDGYTADALNADLCMLWLRLGLIVEVTAADGGNLWQRANHSPELPERATEPPAVAMLEASTSETWMLDSGDHRALIEAVATDLDSVGDEVENYLRGLETDG